ncbi:uncharacterized protein LOC132804096 isoform X2 [Ziziphus jujuba]|uniref:Uncharacterized protein LOC132804096 isoform X2 n=1 Tax=Ziziphus jujuba TaxID=326968 RepID=A0ABM4ABC8_ZIZJJ|nr:uncharacterized protein LOC132804096 isoform X2 [Ziziphus jujuba]
MEDFSFLSDTDELAVNELFSQAQDFCVVEQVPTINCFSFVDSLLPTNLESRFPKLKSFPQTNSKLTIRTQLDSSVKGKQEDSDCASDEDSEIFSPTIQKPDKRSDFKKKSQSGLSSVPLDLKDFSVEKDVSEENWDPSNNILNGRISTVPSKGLQMEMVKIPKGFSLIDFSSNNFHGEIPK